MTKERDYTITTWADGFGAWHARADFPYGCDNTGDDERLFKNARRAARAAIVRELVERERTARETEHTARARLSAYLRLKVVANRERPSSGALASITWAERA